MFHDGLLRCVKMLTFLFIILTIDIPFQEQKSRIKHIVNI